MQPENYTVFHFLRIGNTIQNIKLEQAEEKTITRVI